MEKKNSSTQKGPVPVKPRKSVSSRPKSSSRCTYTVLLYVLIWKLLVVGISLYGLLPFFIKSTVEPEPCACGFHMPVPGDQSQGKGSDGGQGEVQDEGQIEEIETVSKLPLPLLVETRNGPIQGIGKDGARIFHGVRFTQPPLGDLRWRPPVPAEPWGPKPYDATWIRPGCPQNCTVSTCPANGTSEDCLFLEIFTPSFGFSRGNRKVDFPVLIFLHGGSFYFASATTPVFNGANLAASTNMVVVLPQYRLGALGFLYTGVGNWSENIQGNLGILDQKLAIQWVFENIQAFGGDPTKITLSGNSAGASSVLTHMESSDVVNLFRYVELESPPLAIPYRDPRSAATRGEHFIDLVGCLKDKSKEERMACMRSKALSEIMEAQERLKPSDVLSLVMPWVPTIDKRVVLHSPLHTFYYLAGNSSAPGANIPMIIGMTEEEGFSFTPPFKTLTDKDMRTISLYYSIATGVTFIDDVYVDPYKITPKDSGETRYSISSKEMVAKMLTDLIFRCPLRDVLYHFASRLKKIPKIWIYHWEFPMPDMLPKDMEHCANYSCHSAELPYFFKTFRKFGEDRTGKHEALSHRFTSYIRNFVYTGDPNKAGIASDDPDTANKRGLSALRWSKRVPFLPLRSDMTALKLDESRGRQRRQSRTGGGGDEQAGWPSLVQSARQVGDSAGEFLPMELIIRRNGRFQISGQDPFTNAACVEWGRTNFELPTIPLSYL